MTSHSGIAAPSAWVSRFVPLIPPGEVLDLACGGGRHARLLAESGHQVLAVDRDADALASLTGPCIVTLRHDLESDNAAWPFVPERFAAVVVANYLYRPLFPHIFASLVPNGVLIYETFARGNEQFGKPSNPDFLLASGELLELVQANTSQPFRVVAFEDGYVSQPRSAVVQRICAVKLGAGDGPARFRLL